MHFSPVPARAIGGVALGLILATAFAAEPPHPLLGATRDQVLSRYGEPKGQISVGSRTVLTYPREKLVLRDGLVVEIEPVYAEPVRRPVAPVEAPEAPAPAPAPAVSANLPRTGGTEDSQPVPAPTPAPAAPASAAPEPKLEIKLVRPPSAGGARPAPVVFEAPKPEPVAEAEPEPPAPPKPDPAALARAAQAAAAKAAKAAQVAAEAAAQDKRLKSAQSARRRLDFAETAESDESGLGTHVMIGLGVVIAGLVGLVWWRRQQALALAATSVENTPVRKSAPAPAAAASGPARPAAAVSNLTAAPFLAKPGFTAPFLASLEAGRFEEFVAAYFTKTGVVATRTKAGAVSPLHIRISWKGEPRAFASVHCIAQGPDDIEARALHGFVAALAAEDLRRGYVVTSGRFSAAAQKFAADKRLTLLPVDALLEKIQGLPESARKELLQTIGEEKKAA